MTISHGSGVWVRFLTDWDYRQPSFTIAYRAGNVYNVPRAAATLAVAAGKAVRLRKASRDSDPAEVETGDGEA